MAEDIGMLVLDVAEAYAEMKLFGFLSQFRNLTALFNPLATSTSFILLNLLANMTTTYQPIDQQDLGGYNIKLDLTHVDPGSVHPPRFTKFETDFAMDEDEAVTTAQWSWLNATEFGYSMNFTGVYTDDLGEMLISPEPNADGTQAWWPNGTVFGQDSVGVWFNGTWTTKLTEADFLMMAWHNQTLPEDERWKMSVTHPVRKGVGANHCGKHHCSGYKGPRPPMAMAPGVEKVSETVNEENMKEEEVEQEEGEIETEGEKDRAELTNGSGMPEWAQECLMTSGAMACLNAAIEGLMGNASSITTRPK